MMKTIWPIVAFITTNTTEMTRILVYLTVLSLALTIHATNGLLRKPQKDGVKDWPCLFSKPCYCDYNYRNVYCNGMRLQKVPPILNYLTGSWNINLSQNNITHIPSRVFWNITVSDLDLSYNNIVDISDDAFAGSESAMSDLRLEYNQLKALPTVIGRMVNMAELHLHRNPMADLNNVGLFQNISKRLSTFTFGSMDLQKWPTAFQYLNNIFDLTMYDLLLEELPVDSFEGLGENLMYLRMFSTNLKSIPTSLNNASRLYHLELKDNIRLTSNGISPVSFKGLRSLREILIHNSPIDEMPPIFNDLSGLGLLSLSNVPIRYINESVFPANFSSEFYKFVFNNTQLDKIPGPKLWARVPTIFEIAITYNSRIQNITDNDFKLIPRVAFLYLSGNPLVSISDNAFHTCKNLVFLYLDNTPLKTFPRALTNAHDISVLDLTNTNITCSCENIGWLKHWSTRPKHLNISGKCFNIDMSLIDYILNEIPKCPNKREEYYYRYRR